MSTYLTKDIQAACAAHGNERGGNQAIVPETTTSTTLAASNVTVGKAERHGPRAAGVRTPSGTHRPQHHVLPQRHEPGEHHRRDAPSAKVGAYRLEVRRRQT